MKKKLEDYSCFIKRITGAFSLKSIHRCAKVTMLSFFTLVAVPCASFAQTNPKDIRNADDLTDAFKPANVNSWDQLNITADISGSDTHNGTPPAGDAVFLLEGYSSTITNRTFTGVGERRTLSYGSSSANKDGRLFGYYGINGNTIISNLGFEGGKLSRTDTEGNSIGGGAVFQDFDQDATITIVDSIFKGNTAAIVTGTAQDAGGGGAYFNGGITPNSGVSVILDNTSFEGNAVKHAASDGNSYGGGASIADVAVVQIDGKGTASFSGNSITAGARGATGGGLYIEGTSVATDTTNVKISNILFSGNSVETTGASASGGGLTFTNKGVPTRFGTVLLENVSFEDNTVNAKTSGNASGGAIFTNHEITIAATTKDVLFDGNRVSSDFGNALGQSIYSSTDVNYVAAAERRVDDLDGMYVQGTVTKTGEGTLGLLGQNAVHTMGDLNVNEGTLESSMYNDGNGVVSSFLADDTLHANADGTVYFGDDTVWRLDLSTLTEAEINAMNSGVDVAAGGFVDGTGVQDATNAQAALERGTEMAFFDLTTDAAGKLIGRQMASVNMSDIRNSALMMHRWNTVRNATSDRMDLNDYYHRNSGSYGSKEYCRANCITNSAWVNYIGRHNRLESSYYLGDDIKMTSNGIQTGVDLISNHRSQLGFMFGYEGQNNKLHSDRIKGDDYYFGLYGMRKLANGADFRTYFGYGFQNYDMDRYSDIAASQLNQSSFDGDVFEINLELGKRLGCDRGVSYRPVIALDYFNNKIDGAYESNSNFYYDDLKLEQLYLRVGSDFQANSGRVKFNGGLFYSIQMLGDGDSIYSNVTSGVQTLRLAGSDLGNSVLTYTLGTSIALNTEETCQLYGGYSGDIFLDRDGTPLLHNGHVGLLWRF